MGFYYLLKALDLPKGGEIIFPALTFWVVPELARVAGLTPVFADVDPRTYTIDPESFERAITPRTCAVVPTHLYGLTCDMDAVMSIARAHGLKVIEDCAHALAARYRGQPAGTFGDGAFFSFQTLKPLNTYGGGAAVARDPKVQARLDELAAAEPWPSEERIRKRFRLGLAQRTFIRPGRLHVFAVPAAVDGVVRDAQPGRVSVGEDPSAVAAARALHGAVLERAGGDRPQGARAPRRVDRRIAGARADSGRAALGRPRRRDAAGARRLRARLLPGTA